MQNRLSGVGCLNTSLVCYVPQVGLMLLRPLPSPSGRTHCLEVPFDATNHRAGVLLLMSFLAWLTSARMLCQSLFGYAAPESCSSFINQVLTTPESMRVIVSSDTQHGIFIEGCGTACS